jgi:hypothetical protein
MNKYVVIGIIGIISSLLASLADVPLVNPKEKYDQIPGKHPVKWWQDVTDKRFELSFWLSFLGQPGTYLVMWMLAVLIGKNSVGLGLALKINTFIGCYTGLLCHVVYCMKPLLYRRLYKKLDDKEVEETFSALDMVSKVPMMIGFATLWLGSTVIVVSAIINGALAVPKICLLLNPVPSTLVLLILKKCNVRIIGALGAGFMMFSILLMIAGFQV